MSKTSCIVQARQQYVHKDITNISEMITDTAIIQPSALEFLRYKNGFFSRYI